MINSIDGLDLSELFGEDWMENFGDMDFENIEEMEFDFENMMENEEWGFSDETNAMINDFIHDYNTIMDDYE